MRRWCSSDLWDWNTTWHSEVPDFTPCFQHTVLVLIPCALFWVCGTYDFWKHTRRKFTPLPWTALNVSQVGLCTVLLASSAWELCLAGYLEGVSPESSDVMSIFCYSTKVSTNILITSLVILHKLCGTKSSSLLSVFWFVQIISGVVLFRSSFLKAHHQPSGRGKNTCRCFHGGRLREAALTSPSDSLQDSPSIPPPRFVLGVLPLPLACCQFFLSLFSSEGGRRTEKKSPMEEKSYISFFTFCWMDSFILSSRKRSLSVGNLPPLPSRLKARPVWNAFRARRFHVPSKGAEEVSVAQQSLTRSLVRTFWPRILLFTVLRVVGDLLAFAPPFLLDSLISFISSDEHHWRGQLYCFALFASLLVGKIANQVFWLQNGISALQIKAALSGAIYRKVLRMSSSSRSRYTSGEMINLLAVDVDRVFNFIQISTTLFSCPLRLLLIGVFLWRYLGAACLAGLAVVAAILPVTMLTAKLISSLQAKQMKFKDFRLKYMNEMLNSIKVLKFNAWEVPFMKKVADVRRKEVDCIRSFLYCYTASSFMWGCAPFLIAVACFVTYVLVDETHVLSPNVVFVSLNLLSMLKFAFFVIPEVMAALVQSNISLGRIQTFLLSEETEQGVVGNVPVKGAAVSVRGAVLAWGGDAPVLRGVDLQVPRGGVVAVVGPVGAGKSSLLAALLGDMRRTSGSLDLEGSIAYVPQQAWILNRSVRENILFGKQMDRAKYLAVLDCCCLRPDLALLPAADDTEVGEKGVNLSGGQRQRLSLARAAFQEADLYLLDDPLSAVDAHVARDLFRKVIGREGLLRDKTRVLVTHNVSVLPLVDVVVSMRDGRIEEAGAYEELMARGGSFRDFIGAHAERAAAQNSRCRVPSPHEHNNDIVPGEQATLEPALYLSKTSSLESISNAGRLIAEERMETGGINYKVYIDYSRHAGIHIFLPLILFYMAFQAFEIGSNVWLGRWSNDGPQSAALRDRRIAVYAGIGLCQAVCLTLGNVLLAVAAARASARYHALMLRSVMRSPVGFFDATPIGRLVNRFGKDLEAADCDVPMHLDGFLACLFLVAGTATVVGAGSPLCLLLLLPVAGALYALQKLYLRASRQLKRLDAVTRSPVLSHLQESVQGAASVKAYGAQEAFVAAFESKMDANLTCFFNWFLCTRWLSLRLDLASGLVVLAVSVLAVENRASADPAFLGLALFYVISMTDPLIYLIRNSTELEIKAISLERIKEYSHLPPEAPWNIPDKDPPPAWPEKGEVRFEHFGTRYRKELDLAVKGISFQIASNEKVGLVGRTGSGKTTVTLALFRMLEAAEGAILVDGVDISTVGLHALRSRLTIIPQEPVLFCGSIRTNLDPHGEHDDDALWRSLERTRLKSCVRSLPQGLDHEITEGGENLSVGQRQLLCLSRALLQKSKILVLDEATAAVDMDTDRLVQETLRAEFRDHTVLTVAHRLHTVLDYDKIVVMDAGRVAEIGSPAELLKDTRSRFYSMAHAAHLL